MLHDNKSKTQNNEEEVKVNTGIHRKAMKGNQRWVCTCFFFKVNTTSRYLGEKVSVCSHLGSSLSLSVQDLMHLACSSVFCGGGTNQELAHHCLYECKGDIMVSAAEQSTPAKQAQGFPQLAQKWLEAVLSQASFWTLCFLPPLPVCQELIQNDWEDFYEDLTFENAALKPLKAHFVFRN